MRLLFRLFQLSLPLVPLGLFELAHQFPRVTETVYSQRLYPLLARGLGALFGNDYSIAERALLLGVGLAFVWQAVRWIRFRSKRWLDSDDRPSAFRRAAGAAIWIWFISGCVFLLFLLLWGFNYARPSLATRMGIEPVEIDSAEVLALGIKYAERARVAHEQASLDDDSETELPFTFDELNRALDAAFARRELPGDKVKNTTMPAKRLSGSLLLSYLGLSGIFIPFTGEPSINAMQPDVAIPFVAAHEKAHQHAITNEGEANFVAFLVCSDSDSPPYIQYSAYVMAASRLLSEASRYHSREEMEAAWRRFGAGPLKDIEAIQAFWERYQGIGTEVAERVNDRYLETMRVPGGAQSYGTVVELLVAWEREQR